MFQESNDRSTVYFKQIISVIQYCYKQEVVVPSTDQVSYRLEASDNRRRNLPFLLIYVHIAYYEPDLRNT